MKYIGIPRIIVNYTSQFLLQPMLIKNVQNQFQAYDFKEEIFKKAY
jgi:hypothetical protein